jgi:type VI secretion system protein ImpK
MRDDLARLVNPIFRTALDLQSAWATAGGPSFDAGRERLRERFRDLHRLHPPIRGDATASDSVDLIGRPSNESGDDAYLGVGFPLACWVDELFTLHSPVAGRWTDRKFEAEYHGTNDRAWRFWKQADLATGQPIDDHLEVFFLCAALGFRGDKVDDPTGYAGWAAATRDRLQTGVQGDWVGPAAIDPPAAVPPRYGRGRLRRMALVAGLFALVAIPAVAWLITRQLVR